VVTFGIMVDITVDMMAGIATVMCNLKIIYPPLFPIISRIDKRRDTHSRWNHHGIGIAFFGEFE
jgi:hypothetical protein